MSQLGGPGLASGALRRLAAAARRDDGRPAFLDGLLLGAMVGAAIAGSTVWSRWRASRRTPTRDQGPNGQAPPGASDDVPTREPAPGS